MGVPVIWPRYTGVSVPVHPRTLLWWEQREQCVRCLRSHQDGDATNGCARTHFGDAAGLRCSEVRRHIGGGNAAGRNIDVYCIDARSEGALCGPDARLFKPTT